MLKFGYLRMDDFDLAFFTHCHHALGNATMMQYILTDNYHYDLSILHTRPKTWIIGLTEPEHIINHVQALATIFDACYSRATREQYFP